MIGFIVLLVPATLFLLLPLWHSRGSAAVDTDSNGRERAALNRQVLAEQLAELETERREGRLAAAQFEQLESELLAQVLLDTPASARAHEEHSASGTPKSVIALALTLLLAIAAVYQYTGFSSDVAAQQAVAEFQSNQVQNQDKGARSERLGRLLAVVQQRTERRQDNAAWWYMQAQLQSEMARFAESAESYAAVLALDTSSADVWAEYAQAQFLAGERQLSATASEAIDKALAIDPNQTTALGLRGMAAFEAQDFATATSAWGQLLQRLDPTSRQYQLISAAYQQASAQGGGAPAADIEKTASVTVLVSAADIDLPAETTVFVYARAADGPKMPLAIKRMTLAELPARVELTDAMAMMPAMKLSMFDAIELIARASPAGRPTPTKGDWQASSGPLQRADLNSPVKLVIDTAL